MADEYISRKAAMEYLYRAINADPEGNCPNCIHDEHDCQYDRCWTLMDFCEKIEYIGYVPAADVVPVVRCKDCKYNLANIPDIQDGVNINENWNACQLTELLDSVEQMDFCSHGAKMDGENG